MTLTEFAYYKCTVYLENGWITEEQAKKFRRDMFISGCVALILPPLIVGALICIAFIH